MISRSDKKEGFVQVDLRIFNDPRLSNKSLGLLIDMLRRPNHWSFSVKEIASHRKDSKESIYSSIKELIACGYVIKRQARDKNGRLQNVVYDVNENACYGFENADKNQDFTVSGFPVNGKTVNGITVYGNPDTSYIDNSYMDKELEEKRELEAKEKKERPPGGDAADAAYFYVEKLSAIFQIAPNTKQKKQLNFLVPELTQEFFQAYSLAFTYYTDHKQEIDDYCAEDPVFKPYNLDKFINNFSMVKISIDKILEYILYKISINQYPQDEEIEINQLKDNLKNMNEIWDQHLNILKQKNNS